MRFREASLKERKSVPLSSNGNVSNRVFSRIGMKCCRRGRISFMEWSSIYQTGKNVLSMRSKASTRLHGIRFIYRRTFSKEESINDGLRRYIYNIRAPRYLLLPLFEYFLWYSISFTTRGPFNYSRCGITPTVIFVHANASRCISFSPSSFYPPPLSPGHISG